MRASTRLLVGLGLAQLVATPVFAGHVSVFLGSPGGTGSVRVFDEAGLAPPQHPPELQGIRLLDIELSGRTQLEELLADRARWRDDVPQAARIQLPEGRGSLYRYERVEPAGVVHGLMLVGSDGAARSLLELAEAWPEVPAFHPRVAVSPRGDAVLVATTFAAGGDLLELDVLSGSVTVRTAGLPPQHLEGHGLGLRDGWGVGIGADAVLRFQRVAGAQAQVVPFAPAPAWYGREVVFSASGQFAATIAGDQPALSNAWVFSASGPARRVGTAPAPLAGAGFLPDVQGGPWLAVSDDGTLCAWKTDSGHGYSRELFLGRVPDGSAMHVTQDALFEPYIDEIGQYAFTPSGELLFGAGNPKGVGKGALVDMDVFQARWTPSGELQLLNLTLSSGEATPPFVTYPRLQPERTVLLPSRNGVLVHSVEQGAHDLLSTNLGVSGAQVPIASAHSLTLLDLAEDEHLLLAQRGVNPAESGLRDLELPVEEGPETLFALPSTHSVSRVVTDGDDRMALVAASSSSELVWRLDDEHVELLTPRPLVYGPTLWFTPTGALALSVGATGSPSLFLVWKANGAPRRLQSAAAIGFVLPGA